MNNRIGNSVGRRAKAGRRLLLSVIGGVFLLPLFAQDSTARWVPSSFSAQDTALLREPTPFKLRPEPGFLELLDKYEDYNRKREFADGYRIQIMYTNVRDEAYSSKGAMYVEFPDLPSYVEYEPPYYKLRIGNFKDRLEATYHLQKIIATYPGAFIVRDKIKIR